VQNYYYMENRVRVAMGTKVGFRSQMWIWGWMFRTQVGIVSPKCLNGDDALAAIGVRSGVHQVVLAV